MQKGSKDFISSPDFLKRLLIYGIMTLLLASAQCAFFPVLEICPKTPDLILAMLVAIALLDSSSAAAICALPCGFFVDAIGSSSISITPLIYFSAVFFICIFTQKILKSFASFLFLLIPALFCRAIGTYVCIWIADRALPRAWVFVDVLLPEAICTAICALPIYFIVKLCMKPLKSHGRFSF